MKRGQKTAAFAASSVMFILAGCSSNPTSRGRIPIEKTHPLPEIAASDKNFSSYKPSIAYQELGASVLTRTVFETAGPAGYHMEIKDVRVDGQKKAENISFPGAAFLQVLEGGGAMTVAGKRQELRGAATVPLSQGQTATLEATSKEPLLIRVRLVRAE